jgi:transaldolase
LRNVFDAGRAGARDGWVSLEVDPNLAYQPEETIAAGISVNITLLFSLERHCAAAEAYIRRLRRWLKAGGDLFSVASVASFFVSRVDTEADRRLEHAEGYDDLKGALAIADAKLAYQTYRRLFSGSEWAELQAAGASPQRCLWASTSTKNPDYQDVRYVERLIGPDTVNTMPRETIDAFIDHGQVRPTLTAGVDDARQTLQRFSQAGLDYDDIVAVLEREGVEKFASSFRSMLDAIDAKRPELTAA